jgi:hypothetical protein
LIKTRSNKSDRNNKFTLIGAKHAFTSVDKC